MLFLFCYIFMELFLLLQACAPLSSYTTSLSNNLKQGNRWCFPFIVLFPLWGFFRIWNFLNSENKALKFQSYSETWQI